MTKRLRKSGKKTDWIFNASKTTNDIFPNPNYKGAVVLISPDKVRSEIIHQIQSIHCYNKTANALDFQLCSYLGYLIRGGSKSSYCILTNDKGFDAAVSFWAEKGIKIYRHSLAAEIGYPDKTRVGYMPNLGAILSLKANNPDLKTIEKIIKESDSVAVVLNKITTVLGTRTGKNYCKKLEKHLKKYYLVNK